MGKALIILFFLSLLTACASTQPTQEYALAQSVLAVAKKFSAEQFAPKTYSKALGFYKKAEFSYRQKDYESARNFFEKSIALAEKAELKARIRKLRETE